MDIKSHFLLVAEKIARKEGIENGKLDYQYSGTKGGGFSGDIAALKLEGTNGKSLALIFKHASTNETHRRMSSIREAFLREIAFYEECIPSLQKLQEEHHIEDLGIFPKCYYTVSEPMEELLVLDNLSMRNFDKSPQDALIDVHLKKALETYGKFNALSMALKAKKPEEYAKLKKLLQGSEKRDVLFIMLEQHGYFEALHEMAIELIDIFDETTEKHYFDKFKEFAYSTEQRLREIYSQEEHEVMSQGDAWFNNMLFQYSNPEDKEKPIECTLVDFQMLYMRPVSCDLAFLIYTVATKEEMRNLDMYLKLYHDSLGKHLAKFNLNVNELLSFEDLISSWKKYSMHALIWCSMMRKIFLMDPDEIPDIAKLSHEGKIAKGFQIKLRKVEEYRRLYKDIAIHFIDRNFI